MKNVRYKIRDLSGGGQDESLFDINDCLILEDQMVMPKEFDLSRILVTFCQCKSNEYIIHILEKYLLSNY